MKQRFIQVLVGLVGVALVAAIVLEVRPDWALGAAMQFERGRAGLEQKTVSVGEHEITYLEGGSGSPLLLVHGFGGDKDNWTRLARYLTEHHRVIALDLPGFGESTRDESVSYDIIAQMERLYSFQQALSLGKVHLVGNSRGGQIVTHFAAVHRDAAASLTLLNARGVESPVLSDFDQILETGLHPLIIRDVKDYEKILDWVFVDKPYIPRAVMAYFAKRAVLSHAFQQKVYADQKAKPAPLDDVLGQVKVPTLVAWGDHDRIIDPSTAEVFHLGIEGSQLVIIHDCGHMPQIEKAAKVSDLILSHVSSASQARQP